MLLALALIGLAAASPATAADRLVPADDAASATLVTGGEISGVYHRLEAGGALDFSVPGPATVTVEVRRRLPAAGARPPGVRVALLGDGVPVLELVAGQPAARGTKVHDGRGGLLSAPDLATLTVPASGRLLTVRSPAGSPDLLVRVRRDTRAR